MCTTILIGKKASYDGSTLVARIEDSSAGMFKSKKFIVIDPKDQPIHYKSVRTDCEIELPKNPMRYTCLPNVKKWRGVWGACGVNEKNVSMTATETITTNERVLGADPLVEFEPGIIKKGGIGEEDFVVITLPYINSAKEGVVELSVGTVLKIAKQQVIGVFGSIASLAHLFAELNQAVQFWCKERPVITVLCLLPDLVSLCGEADKVTLKLNGDIYQLASIAAQNFNLCTMSLIKQSAVLVKSIKQCTNSRITEGLLDLLAKDCQGFSTLFSSLFWINAGAKRANLVSCIVKSKEFFLKLIKFSDIIAGI